MISTFPKVLAIVLTLSVSACASLSEGRCEGGGQPQVQDTLYFGNGKPNGVVSGEEWARFLEATVTPRYPHGLTVIDASGQWMSDKGPLVREASRVLQIVHPDDHADDDLIAAIIAAYKTQFFQESVLRVKVQACVSF